MSTPQDSTATAPEPVEPVQPTPPATSHPVEIVPRGILFSLLSIPLGTIAAVLLWRAGFVASISSFLVAASAVFLYSKGALSAPRRGLLPLIGVIVVGVVVSFLGIVASDLVEYSHTPDGQSLGYPTTVDFVSSNLLNGDVIGSYGSDLAMFVLFAVLGVFGTMYRLVRSTR